MAVSVGETASCVAEPALVAGGFARLQPERTKRVRKTVVRIMAIVTKGSLSQQPSATPDNPRRDSQPRRRLAAAATVNANPEHPLEKDNAPGDRTRRLMHQPPTW